MKNAILSALVCLTINTNYVSAEVVKPNPPMEKLQEVAGKFEKLKAAFNKWGTHDVWEQVRGRNANQAGGQDLAPSYSLFSGKEPLKAVRESKVISANPLENDKSTEDSAHIKKIIEELKKNDDGKVTLQYSRMEKNPADDDGKEIEVHYYVVAWGNSAFGIKKDENEAGKFFVYQELTS